MRRGDEGASGSGWEDPAISELNAVLGHEVPRVAGLGWAGLGWAGLGWDSG